MAKVLISAHYFIILQLSIIAEGCAGINCVECDKFNNISLTVLYSLNKLNLSGVSVPGMSLWSIEKGLWKLRDCKSLLHTDSNMNDESRFLQPREAKKHKSWYRLNDAIKQ